MKDIKMPSVEETQTFEKAAEAFKDKTYKSIIIDMAQELSGYV